MRGRGGGRRGGGAAGRRNRRAEAAAEVERLKAWLAAAAPPRGSLGLAAGERSGSAAKKPQQAGLVIGSRLSLALPFRKHRSHTDMHMNTQSF